jgi:hypothetical protein
VGIKNQDALSNTHVMFLITNWRSFSDRSFLGAQQSLTCIRAELKGPGTIFWELIDFVHVKIFTQPLIAGAKSTNSPWWFNNSVGLLVKNRVATSVVIHYRPINILRV